MPARQNVRRVMTPELQGADSWVDIKSITVGDYNLMLQLVRESQTGDEAAIRRSEAQMHELYARCIVGWNWVDDDGEPLPQPSEDVSVFDRLTMDELAFLAEALRSGLDKKKMS